MNLRNKVPFFMNYASGYFDTVSGTSPLNLPKAKAGNVKNLIAFGGTEQLPENYIDSVTAEGKCEQKSSSETIINATVVEPLTENDGVYSGFGSAGYAALSHIETSNIFNFHTNSWAVELDFTTGAVDGSYQQLAHFYNAPRGQANAKFGVFIGISNANKFNVVHSSNGTSWTGSMTGSYTVQSNTHYKFRYSFNGTIYKSEYSLDNGTTWIENTTYNSSSLVVDTDLYLNLGIYFDSNGDSHYQDPFKGSIDLKETFVNINGTTTSFWGYPTIPTPDAPIDIVCNNGTIKARHQSGLPLGYTLLNYATFDGTQEVDTGLYIHLNDEIRSKFQGSVGSTFAYGASTSNPRITCYLSSGNQRWGNVTVSNTGISGTALNTVVHNKTAFTVNGTSTNYPEGTDFTTNVTLTIGNCNGNISTAWFSGNFYYMEIDESGVLVAKMLPCTSPNNTVGFYDVVRNIFLAPTTGTLVAGTTATDPIEIYTDGTTETITDNQGNVATCQNLLSVGDYKDTQEILSGAVTRNIGIKVFDGSENWLSGGNNTGVYMTLGSAGSFVAGAGYCTHSIINPNSPNIVDMNQNEFCLYSNGNMSFKNAYTTSVSDWKTFLSDQYAAGTPVIIVYPLSTATTETVTGQYLEKEPLTVTGSLSNLVVNAVSSSHTAPTPIHPLDINCNNGVLKVNKNLITGSLTQGIYNNGVLDPTVTTWVAYDTLIPVESGKTYTLKAIPSVSGKTIEQNVMKYKDGVYIGYTALANVPYTFTPDSTYNQVKLQFAYKPRENITPSNITDIQLYQNGSIYTDGTQETIRVGTRNLFDEQWNRNTGTSTQTATWGQVVYANGWSTSSLIPVKAGQQYTVSYNTTVQIYVFYYESDGTMQQSYDTVNSTKKTFTVPNGATHIRLQVNKSTDAAIAALETQLELGSTATTYEPYYNGGSFECPMLLSVGS